MAFTTWTELHRRMLDDLASDAWRRHSSYSISTGSGGTQSFTHRTFAEFLALLDMVKREAAVESGPTYHGRTFAANGGRGGCRGGRR